MGQVRRNENKLEIFIIKGWSSSTKLPGEPTEIADDAFTACTTLDYVRSLLKEKPINQRFTWNYGNNY